MSVPGPLTDWLQTLDKLDPQDQQTRESIARLLGLEWRRPVRRDIKAKSTSRPLPSNPRAPAQPAQVEPTPAMIPKAPRRIESVLTTANAGRHLAPGWLATAEPLPSTEQRHIRPLLPLEPLFPKRTTRALLSGALSTPSCAGPIDVRSLIKSVSSAEIIQQVPRISVPTLVRGVQLLIDSSEAMQLFAADQAALRSALISVAGRDRTEVLYFESTPLRGCGTGAKEDWPPYTPPSAGTPVVLLTDLGIAQPPESSGLASAAEWAELASIASRALCPVLAFVPYPAKRWPAVLTRKMSIIQWDRGTTAASVRKVIGRALRVATGALNER